MQINRCGKGGGSPAGSRGRRGTARVQLNVDDRDLVLVQLCLLKVAGSSGDIVLMKLLLVLMLLRLSWLMLLLLLRVVGVATTRRFFSLGRSTSLISGEQLGL